MTLLGHKSIGENIPLFCLYLFRPFKIVEMMFCNNFSMNLWVGENRVREKSGCAAVVRIAPSYCGLSFSAG